MDVTEIPAMPPTDEREEFIYGYLESNISWASRNNEALEWMIENHVQIRKAVGSSPYLLAALQKLVKQDYNIVTGRGFEQPALDEAIQAIAKAI